MSHTFQAGDSVMRSEFGNPDILIVEEINAAGTEARCRLEQAPNMPGEWISLTALRLAAD